MTLHEHDSRSEVKFPWVAAIAPVATAVAMWLVLGSPVALLLGGLSPLIAVTQFVATRRVARRRDAHSAQRDAAQTDRELEATREQHNRRVAELVARFPPARDLEALIPVARFDKSRPAASQFVAPRPDAPRRPRDLDERLELRLGVRPNGEPVVIDSDDGVVLAGAATQTRSVARALTAQAWWASGRVIDNARVCRPTGRWLVTVGGREATLTDRDAPGVPPERFLPDRLDAMELASLRNSLVDACGVVHAEGDADTALAAASQGTRRGLMAGVGNVTLASTGTAQNVELDLVAHGPHAIVSGTTGSGKTTFIINWMLALAGAYDPSELEIAIIDFKGGIDFGPLARLDHCVGFATDADAGSVERALMSLETEMTRRERRIRAGNPNESLPRLVVILDEFRATATVHPHAVSTVIDVVARGRALGIHVIICTQRASTGISEDILANAPLRVAFRALSATESKFMIGDDTAATALREPGVACVVGISPETVVVRMHEHVDTLPRTGATRGALWMPALPAELDIADLEFTLVHHDTVGDGGGTSVDAVWLGLMDAPAQQTWHRACYSPHADGHLLVTGRAMSGKTSTLRSLVRQLEQRERRVVWVDAPTALWDALDPRFRTHDNTHTEPHVLAIDGIEQIFARTPAESRDVLIERVMLALREPSGARLLLSCDAEGPWATRLGSLCASRLDLTRGAPTRATASVASAANLPGRAIWRGADLQVVRVPDPATYVTGSGADMHSAQGPLDGNPLGGSPLDAILVTRTGATHHFDFAATLREQGFTVDDSATVDQWMLRLADFELLSATHAVVVDPRLTGIETRMLLRAHTPVPPATLDSLVVLYPDGTYGRRNVARSRVADSRVAAELNDGAGADAKGSTPASPPAPNERRQIT